MSYIQNERRKQILTIHGEIETGVWVMYLTKYDNHGVFIFGPSATKLGRTNGVTSASSLSCRTPSPRTTLDPPLWAENPLQAGPPSRPDPTLAGPPPGRTPLVCRAWHNMVTLWYHVRRSAFTLTKRTCSVRRWPCHLSGSLSGLNLVEVASALFNCRLIYHCIISCFRLVNYRETNI